MAAGKIWIQNKKKRKRNLKYGQIEEIISFLNRINLFETQVTN